MIKFRVSIQYFQINFKMYPYYSYDYISLIVSEYSDDTCDRIKLNSLTNSNFRTGVRIIAYLCEGVSNCFLAFYRICI